uniref:MMPL domain-containing protein n=1 Tax=Macrostomum lignano TaxID=282301 RepID=A0A1I8F3I0_9PLAT
QRLEQHEGLPAGRGSNQGRQPAIQSAGPAAHGVRASVRLSLSDWIDAGKMAGLMSLLLAAAALASLAVFCKLLPAVVCSALCLINLLQLAAMLWASGIPLNLLTCTGAALAFPVMFFVNLMLVFQLSLQPPPSPAAAELALTPWPGAEDTRPAEEADSGSRQKQRSDNVEGLGPAAAAFRPDWPLARCCSGPPPWPLRPPWPPLLPPPSRARRC